MLNLHNLTEDVANTQTERAARMGEVRSPPLRCPTPRCRCACCGGQGRWRRVWASLLCLLPARAQLGSRA
jgi:hypothetical protein